MNKKLLQSLLAVFLLAALLIPVTAFGEDGTASSTCENGHNMPDKANWEWEFPATPGSGAAYYTATATCLDCRKEFSSGRQMVAMTSSRPATCTRNKFAIYTNKANLGGKDYTDTQEVEVPGTMTAHSIRTVWGKAATCAKIGLTKGEQCQLCGKWVVEQTVIPKTDHLKSDIVTTKQYQPYTCTEDGYKAEKKCRTCGQIVQEATRIPAPGHKEVVDTAVAATCTKAGKTEGKHCSVCKKVLVAQEEVPAKGHTIVTDAAKAATCTENGLTEGSHCSVCSWVKQMQTSIPATGHAVAKNAETVWNWNIPDNGSFATVTVSAPCQKCGNSISAIANSATYWQTTNATCTTGGKRIYSVTVPLGGQEFYGEKEVDDPDAPATGHTPVVDAAVAATCTKTGLTEGSHCGVCNEVLTKQEVVPAKGHTPVVDAAVAATCTETGLTEGSHCGVCNEVLTKQEVVPAKGHTPVVDAAVAATCTKTGLTEGSHCGVCNEVLTKQEAVPAKGHTPIVDAAVAATCTETGLTEGSHCGVCNEVLTKQEAVPTRGSHVFGSWYVTIRATEAAAGEEESRCLYCSETQTRTIPALGTEEQPRLHVLDKTNEERYFEIWQQGDTLIVTSEYEEVTTLTGTSAVLQKLLEQGVRILEFVTPQGTVRVEIVPLLAAMGSSGTFKLSVTRHGASLLVNEVMHNELLR